MSRVTITGLFDNPGDAADARRDIEAFGISRNDIGLLAQLVRSTLSGTPDSSDAASGRAGTGAGIGTVAGRRRRAP